MEFLEAATWITIGKIILIDILLAGDNAVVIGMAAGKLAPELQKESRYLGTVGAIECALYLPLFSGSTYFNSSYSFRVVALYLYGLPFNS